MYNANTVSKRRGARMELSFIQEQMKEVCKTKNWRNLVGLIDDGYKGMFVILRILQENGTVTAGQLAKEMNVSTARIASAINTLENKNYVRREKNDEDARKVTISITPQGDAVFNERKIKIEKMLAPVFENLTEEEIETFFAILKKALS